MLYHDAYKIWILVVGITLIGSVLMAQPAQTNYRHFDMRHGLAQMKVHCIHEDSRGNLWIGTRNGLSKFNGEKFINYYTEDGLIGNRILLISEDDKGNLIFVTENGISIFDGAKFKNISLNLSHDPDAIEVKRDSSIFVFYNSSKICTYYFTNHELKCIDKPAESNPFDDGSPRGYDFYYYNKNHSSNLVPTTRKGDLNSRAEQLYNKRDSINKTIHLNYNHADLDSVSYLIPEWESPYYKDYSIYLSTGAGLRINHSYVIGISQSGYKWSIQTPTRIVQATESKTNQILVSSESGIYIIQPPHFYHFEEGNPSYVWSIIESNQGDFIGHSWSNGLHRINQDFEVEAIPIPLKAKGHFSLRSAKDKKGVIYLPHYAIPRIMEDGALNVDYEKFNTNQFSMHYDPIRDWIVGSMEDKISIIQNDSIRTIDMKGKGITESEYYNSISQDVHDNYWLTSYSGLCRYNPDINEAIDFGSSYDSLVNEGTFGMHQSDRLLWLGLNLSLIHI